MTYMKKHSYVRTEGQSSGDHDTVQKTNPANTKELSYRDMMYLYVQRSNPKGIRRPILQHTMHVQWANPICSHIPMYM